MNVKLLFAGIHPDFRRDHHCHLSVEEIAAGGKSEDRPAASVASEDTDRSGGERNEPS